MVWRCGGTYLSGGVGDLPVWRCGGTYLSGGVGGLTCLEVWRDLPVWRCGGTYLSGGVEGLTCLSHNTSAVMTAKDSDLIGLDKPFQKHSG